MRLPITAAPAAFAVVSSRGTLSPHGWPDPKRNYVPSPDAPPSPARHTTNQTTIVPAIFRILDFVGRGGHVISRPSIRRVLIQPFGQLTAPDPLLAPWVGWVERARVTVLSQFTHQPYHGGPVLVSLVMFYFIVSCPVQTGCSIAVNAQSSDVSGESKAMYNTNIKRVKCGQPASTERDRGGLGRSRQRYRPGAQGKLGWAF